MYKNWIQKSANYIFLSIIHDRENKQPRIQPVLQYASKIHMYR